MSKLTISASIAMAVLVLIPAIAFSQGIQTPCRFYGTVRLDGLDVPDGTVITAMIEGDTHTTTTPAIYGSSTYALEIVPPGGKYYNDGTPIYFIIDNYDAVQTATWEAGSNIRLNLTGSTAPPPTPTPSPTLIPTPTPVTTPTPIPTLVPAVTPSPIPTIVPVLTPPPTSHGTTSVNWGKVIGLTIFGIVDVILIGLLIYLLWRFFLRTEEES